jgi:hypothetical protein
MWGTDDTYDKDVFGNRPCDSQGNLDGRDVFGNEPKDVWGNPQSVWQSESGGSLGDLYGWMYDF